MVKSVRFVGEPRPSGLGRCVGLRIVHGVHLVFAVVLSWPFLTFTDSRKR